MAAFSTGFGEGLPSPPRPKEKDKEKVEAVSMADMRTNLASLVSRASKEGIDFIIHSRGKPKAVMMSIEEYQDLRATLDELNDPEALRLLKEGIDDIENRRVKTVEEIFGEALS